MHSYFILHRCIQSTYIHITIYLYRYNITSIQFLMSCIFIIIRCVAPQSIHTHRTNQLMLVQTMHVIIATTRTTKQIFFSLFHYIYEQTIYFFSYTSCLYDSKFFSSFKCSLASFVWVSVYCAIFI